ncbi:MAG: RNA-binding protein [Clostridium butyricum]|nr:RNA-binding protein [Clostridium butyricum]
MKEIINRTFSDEDKVEVLSLYEKYKLALDKDIPMFGNGFYTPNIWKWFEQNTASKAFKVQSNGIFEEAERRMIAFNNIYDIPYPMILIKISHNSKFSNLSHRDYLGGILGLGIQRNKIGDLLVQGNSCYVPVHEDVKDYLLYNVEKIGKASCKVEVLEDYEELPQYKFKEEMVLVSSLRLDGIVSKISNVSRAKAQELIEQGQVLLDYVKIRDKSHELKSGERITIRGNGKFILGEKLGKSKSGRIKIIIKKYT